MLANARGNSAILGSHQLLRLLHAVGQGSPRRKGILPVGQPGMMSGYAVGRDSAKYSMEFNGVQCAAVE